MTDYSKQNILFWELIKPHSVTHAKTVRIENGSLDLGLPDLGIVGSTRVDKTYNLVGSANSTDTTNTVFYIENGIIKTRDTSLLYSVYGLNSPRVQDS